MKTIRKLVQGVALCAAITTLPGHALAQQAKPGVQLSNVAQKEIEVDEDGKKVRKLVEPGKMVPGDEAVYTIGYRNDAARPADKVIVTNPVPQHTRLRAGSVEGAGTEIDYSVDGGKTFAMLGKLSVTTTGADGKAAPRAATAADVTHLRWIAKNPVAPGASGFVRFRAVIL